jgi:hypothetical protein
VALWRRSATVTTSSGGLPRRPPRRFRLRASTRASSFPHSGIRCGGGWLSLGGPKPIAPLRAPRTLGRSPTSRATTPPTERRSRRLRFTRRSGRSCRPRLTSMRRGPLMWLRLSRRRWRPSRACRPTWAAYLGPLTVASPTVVPDTNGTLLRAHGDAERATRTSPPRVSRPTGNDNVALARG